MKGFVPQEVLPYMTIERITAGNFDMTSMDDFDRSQTVGLVYRLKENRLTLESEPFTETWSLERRREKAAEILSGDYIVYGAFDGGRVAGTLMLIPKLNNGRMIIDSYHVSAEHRRMGIGRKLFKAAKAEALSHHAKALYTSACPAKETIDFYTAMGFKPSEDPIPACVEDEPYDIQMECPI